MLEIGAVGGKRFERYLASEYVLVAGQIEVSEARADVLARHEHVDNVRAAVQACLRVRVGQRECARVYCEPALVRPDQGGYLAPLFANLEEN